MSRSDWIPSDKYPEMDVKVLARIRRNDSGEVRSYESTSSYDDEVGGVNPYWWSEGNAGCDCNRHLFFTKYDSEIDCSEGLYSVNLINPKTGEVFYREFEE